MTDSTPKPPVTAVVKPARRLSLAWIIPAAALLLALGLAWRAWSLRGTMITIQLENGHGLREGDSVRYRGIVVGQVRSIKLSDDLQTLQVKAAILQQANRIARAGSRFWVVRPRIGIEGVGGLETLMGPRYLEVEPGNGAAGAVQREFVGLREAPIVPRLDLGDLEIILQAADRGSLRPAAPVTYRGAVVGRLLSVGLTSDGGAVEARAIIFRPYTPLIRASTLFWDSGGARADIGWSGVSLSVDSLSALVSGGVALATPPPELAMSSTEPVQTGHRFILAAEVDQEWLDWQPQAVIGSSELPPGAPMPQPLRAKLTWKQGRILEREKSRHGWVLRTSRGLLGPADLLTAGEGAKEATVSLEADGQSLPIDQSAAALPGGLALLSASALPSGPVWNEDRCRVPASDEPEDCLVVADSAAATLPLAAARFTVQGDQWLVDPRIVADESWHGACVLSRADGKLIGLLLAADEGLRVGLLAR